MSKRRRYQKKADQFVVAVQVDLETDGFTYRKWGAEQKCRPGDWLVNNNGEVYTVAGDVFAATYRRMSPGIYVKTTPVWAEVALESGSVETKEGCSYYSAGDYVVSNREDGQDAYCMSPERFHAMYEPAE